MTAAEQIADLLHAQRVGPRRWMAKCPAHPDRSPSLSIREGRDGRALVYCHAQCDVTDVLRACGLRLRDLFAGPPPSPAQAAEAAAAREAREQREQREREVERTAFNRIRGLHLIADSLGARLAKNPDGPGSDAIARLFHDTLEKIRQAEAAVAK